MTNKRQKAPKVRTNLLVRAEACLAQLLRTTLVSRVVAAWREVSWRSRKRLQKKINVLSFRLAQRSYNAKLLRNTWDGWSGLPGRKTRLPWQEDAAGGDDEEDRRPEPSSLLLRKHPPPLLASRLAEPMYVTLPSNEAWLDLRRPPGL